MAHLDSNLDQNTPGVVFSRPKNKLDNLMPHMIGDVVPLVTQPMIDYLRGKE